MFSDSRSNEKASVLGVSSPSVALVALTLFLIVRRVVAAPGGGASEDRSGDDDLPGLGVSLKASRADSTKGVLSLVNSLAAPKYSSDDRLWRACRVRSSCRRWRRVSREEPLVRGRGDRRVESP